MCLTPLSRYLVDSTPECRISPLLVTTNFQCRLPPFRFQQHLLMERLLSFQNFLVQLLVVRGMARGTPSFPSSFLSPPSLAVNIILLSSLPYSEPFPSPSLLPSSLPLSLTVNPSSLPPPLSLSPSLLPSHTLHYVHVHVYIPMEKVSPLSVKEKVFLAMEKLSSCSRHSTTCGVPVCVCVHVCVCVDKGLAVILPLLLPLISF